MAGITYPVQAKYNPKGEKAAVKGLKNISNAASNLNKVIGAFVITKVFQGISKVVSGATEEFMKDSQALTKYSQAIHNNVNLTKGAVDRLAVSLSKLDGDGIFGGDEIQGAAAIANQFQLTEDQINNVMEAATEMAASGIMPLDQAVKNLSLTYSGNLGQLRKLAPELQGLTKEQLENGKAVEMLSTKYDGFRDKLSGSFKGMDMKFEDRFGGLQSAVGGITQGLKFGMQSAMLGPLEKATEYLESHKIEILKFFYNLPQVFSIIIKTSWEIIKKTFTGAGFKNLIEFIGGSVVVMIKGWATFLLGGVKALLGTIKDLLNVSIGNLWRTIEDFFGKIGNKFIDVINSAVGKIMQAPVIKQLYELISGNKAADFEAIKFRFDTSHAEKNVSWEDTKNSISKRFKELVETYKNGVKNGIAEQKENLAEFTSFYADITAGASDEIKQAIKKDLPKELQDALAIGNDTGTASPDNTATAASTDKAAKSLSIVKQFLSTLGEIGEAVSMILEKNIIGLIISLITKLISAMQGLSPIVDTFMNSISLVMKEVAQIITPIFEKIVRPFINGIKSLGEIIGNVLAPVLQLIEQLLVPILNLLTQSLVFISPLIKAMSVILSMIIKLNPLLTIFQAALKILGDIFVFIYNNIFAPITNGLLMLISMVGNFFIGMYNTVIRVLKGINIFGWRPFSGLSYADSINYNEIKLQKISLDSYENGDGYGNSYLEGGENGSGNQSSGAAASYTAVRDIVMNIEIGNLVGSDGMREFSLMIRDEIKEAEALGR